MDSGMFALLLIAIGFLVVALLGNDLENKANRANQRVTAVVACIENPAYTKELFGQCLADWEGK